jgi:hypothetical protein
MEEKINLNEEISIGKIIWTIKNHPMGIFIGFILLGLLLIFR